MINVAVIAEGYGDIAALPVLLSRTGQAWGEIIIARNPIRSGGWKALKAKNKLDNYLELALSRNADIILIALDLDDLCCVEESRHAFEIIERWKNGRDIEVHVVFFIREYECLFLSMSNDQELQQAAEGIRDAKGAVFSILNRRYKETQDQVELTRSLNIPVLFQRNRSFRKLCKAITGLSYDDLNRLFGQYDL